MIDHETVAQFAQEQNVPFTNFTSLCRAKEVQDLIWAEIEQVNKQFARVEGVKSFRLIEQILTPEDLDHGHEAHFAHVTDRFLKYLAAHKLPDWEEPNMLAKYYISTKGTELSQG